MASKDPKETGGRKLVSILPKMFRKAPATSDETVQTQTITVQTIVDQNARIDIPDLTGFPDKPSKQSTPKSQSQVNEGHLQKTVLEAFIKVVGCRKITVHTLSSDGKIINSDTEEMEGEAEIINITKQEKINSTVSNFLVNSPDQYQLKDDVLGNTNFTTSLSITYPIFQQDVGKDVGKTESCQRPIKGTKSTLDADTSTTTGSSQNKPTSSGEKFHILDTDIQFTIKRKDNTNPEAKETSDVEDEENSFFTLESDIEDDTTTPIETSVSKKITADKSGQEIIPPDKPVVDITRNRIIPKKPVTVKKDESNSASPPKIIHKMTTPTKVIDKLASSIGSVQTSATTPIKTQETVAESKVSNKRQTTSEELAKKEIKPKFVDTVVKSVLPSIGTNTPTFKGLITIKNTRSTNKKSANKVTQTVTAIISKKAANSSEIVDVTSNPNSLIRKTLEDEAKKLSQKLQKPTEKPAVKSAPTIVTVTLQLPENTLEDISQTSNTVKRQSNISDESSVGRECKRKRKPTWKCLEMQKTTESEGFNADEETNDNTQNNEESEMPSKRTRSSLAQLKLTPKKPKVIKDKTSNSKTKSKETIPCTPMIIKQEPLDITETALSGMVTRKKKTPKAKTDEEQTSGSNIVKKEVDGSNSIADLTVGFFPTSDAENDSKSEVEESNKGDEDFSIFNDEVYEKKYGSKFKKILRLHPCQYCPKKYENRSALRKHIRKHRKELNMKNDVCEICNKEFENEHLYKCHLLTHKNQTEDGRYCCPECKKDYSSRGGLLKHLRTDKTCKFEKYKCEFCHSLFANQSSLELHTTRRHIMAAPEKRFKCKKCERAFETIGGLNKHKRNKACERNLTCDFCSRVFTNQYLFSKHTKTHTRVPSEGAVCEECGKVFNSAAILKTHQNSHVKERNFKCEVCGKAFLQKGTLVSHMRIHTGERPFLCVICGSSFRYSCHLKMHTRIHTGETPYGCTECERSFYCKQSLKKHLISHEKRRKKNLSKLETMNIEVKQEYIDISNVVNPSTEEIVFLNTITGEDEANTQYIYTTEDGEEIQGYLADNTDENIIASGDAHVEYQDSQHVVYQTLEGENVTILDDIETSDLNILAETAENYDSSNVTYVIVKK